jgi:hypothetical protein
MYWTVPMISPTLVYQVRLSRRVVDHHVGGLEIPVDHPGLVRLQHAGHDVAPNP